MTFILSDETVNTFGFRVLLSGADLEQFKKNPVMYYNHDDWAMPIGRWENIRLENGRLMADPVFDMEDEKAAKIAGKVERGFLKMASIGLRVIERSEEPKLMLAGQKYPTVTKWQLREASIVGIGANHNAIRLYDENNKLLNDEEIIKLFDKTEPIKIEKKMNKELLKLLSLADNTTDVQLHDAVKEIVGKNKKLQETNEQLEKDKVELADKLKGIEDAQATKQKADAVVLTDKAIKDGIYNADMRDTIIGLFDKDFEGTKAMLENMPKRATLKDTLEGADKSELTKLSDMSWDELDKSGKLGMLKEKYPETFKAKFNEQFGE